MVEIIFIDFICALIALSNVFQSYRNEFSYEITLIFEKRGKNVYGIYTTLDGLKQRYCVQ